MRAMVGVPGGSRRRGGGGGGGGGRGGGEDGAERQTSGAAGRTHVARGRGVQRVGRVGGGGLGLAEEFPTAREVGGPAAIAEEPILADVVKAGGGAGEGE